MYYVFVNIYLTVFFYLVSEFLLRVIYFFYVPRYFLRLWTRRTVGLSGLEAVFVRLHKDYRRTHSAGRLIEDFRRRSPLTSCTLTGDILAVRGSEEADCTHVIFKIYYYFPICRLLPCMTEFLYFFNRNGGVRVFVFVICSFGK